MMLAFDMPTFELVHSIVILSLRPSSLIFLYSLLLWCSNRNFVQSTLMLADQLLLRRPGLKSLDFVQVESSKKSAICGPWASASLFEALSPHVCIAAA